MKHLPLFGLLLAGVMILAPAAYSQEVDAEVPGVETGAVSAERHVQGEITALHEVRILGDGEPHLLARVSVDGGETVHVDLGPRSQLTPLALVEGDDVTVAGASAQLNDRPIVVATRVDSGQESVQIDRSQMQPMSKFSGTIEDTRYVRYEGIDQEHVVAKVRVPERGVILLDLGEASVMKETALTANTPVEFVARLGSIDGRSAYFAQDLRVRDAPTRITRSDSGTDQRVASHSATAMGSERAERVDSGDNRGQRN